MSPPQGGVAFQEPIAIKAGVGAAFQGQGAGDVFFVHHHQAPHPEPMAHPAFRHHQGLCPGATVMRRIGPVQGAVVVGAEVFFKAQQLAYHQVEMDLKVVEMKAKDGLGKALESIVMIRSGGAHQWEHDRFGFSKRELF